MGVDSVGLGRFICCSISLFFGSWSVASFLAFYFLEDERGGVVVRVFGIYRFLGECLVNIFYY